MARGLKAMLFYKQVKRSLGTRIDLWRVSQILMGLELKSVKFKQRPLIVFELNLEVIRCPKKLARKNPKQS
jgi:hypothetical protein